MYVCIYTIIIIVYTRNSAEQLWSCVQCSSFSTVLSLMVHYNFKLILYYFMVMLLLYSIHVYGSIKIDNGQNPQVDIEKDWKLLTIFIGTNDLCLG